MSNIVVIDYGIGNVKSQLNALIKVGADAKLSADRSEILDADAVILPGVGAFAQGMENLKKKNLIDTIIEFVGTGKPFMGICLGMQLLFEESSEFGKTKGLGLIKGKIDKLIPEVHSGLKLPHIGWTEIQPGQMQSWNNSILSGIPPGTPFYFVHSFAAFPEYKEDILAHSVYGNKEFCCAVKKNNIYGTQFHPEKSGEFGLNILKNLKENI